MNHTRCNNDPVYALKKETMTIAEQADKLGISRQTYENRLNTWVEVDINGRKALVNPKQFMYTDEVKAKGQ